METREDDKKKGKKKNTNMFTYLFSLQTAQTSVYCLLRFSLSPSGGIDRIDQEINEDAHTRHEALDLNDKDALSVFC